MSGLYAAAAEQSSSSSVLITVPRVAHHTNGCQQSEMELMCHTLLL